MPKRSRSKRRSQSQSSSQSGGNGYTSASTYGAYVNGSGQQQYDRTFNQSASNLPSNILVGAQGQGGELINTPTSQQLSLIQSAGRGRGRGRSRGRSRGRGRSRTSSRGRSSSGGTRKKKGGLFGSVINQAIVPFGILGLQQSYKRKRGGRK